MAGTDKPASPPCIAVVDDEQSVRTALSRLLRSAGYAVRMFGSGPDFLESLEEFEPSCVVLDLNMPPPNGFDILETLHNAGKGLAIVVISAEDSGHSRARVRPYGARAYLAKPVDEALLLEAVSAAGRASS